MRNKKFSALLAIFVAAIAVFPATNFARGATASHIIINEIFPNPVGDDKESEFVEITNIGESCVDISGWKIMDETSHKKIFPENSIIDSGEYLVLEENLYLNNDSDTVYLLDKNGEKKDDALSYQSYEKAREGFSYSFDGKSWDWTSTPTPEKENVFDSLAEESSMEDSSNSDNKTDAPKKVYSKNLKITELLPNPSADEDTGEFTEIFNADSEEVVNLSGWKLEDKTGNSYPLPGISLQPGKYRAFYRDKSSFSLNNTGTETIFLKNPNGEVIDRISYSGSVKENHAYALSTGKFSWTSTPTPGEKNIISAIEASKESSGENTDGETNADLAEDVSSSENIYLNEIFPNPKDGSDNEYIEIANGGNEPADLYKWFIRDGSKSGKYVFKEHELIEPGQYIVIYRPQSKLALNNSNESVSLHNPRGEIVSSVSYEKSLKNSSYNFDGENWPASNASRSDAGWKWSKYLTPGKENEFDSEPKVKIKKPKRVYKGLFTEFSTKAKDKETKNLKYVWDFGDGGKSYLKNTSHKYLATGKYKVTLSVTDESQTVEKSFSLRVKKYPRPDLEIVKLIPNPAGNDSEGETLDLKNGSDKKVDLADWKIATGLSASKIYNHPISEEIILEPNKTKTITREFCKFSFNNKYGKVRLLSPDGKIIDEVEYEKEKIAEDEAYAKIDGEWQWIAPGEGSLNDNINPEDNIEEIVEENKSDQNSGEILGAFDANFITASSRFSKEDAFIFLSRLNFAKIFEREMSYRSAANPSSKIAYLIASLI